MDINHYNNLNGKEIAVIGMAGRLPMADSLDVFWDKLITFTSLCFSSHSFSFDGE